MFEVWGAITTTDLGGGSGPVIFQPAIRNTNLAKCLRTITKILSKYTKK